MSSRTPVTVSYTHLAVAGAISIGSWYIFVATVDRFWFPVTNLSAFWSQFQEMCIRDRSQPAPEQLRLGHGRRPRLQGGRQLHQPVIGHGRHDAEANDALRPGHPGRGLRGAGGQG